MFKSVFAKYVSVFTALLLCGFLLLLLIFGSVVSHDAKQRRQSTLQNTVRTASETLSEMLRDGEETELSDFLSLQEIQVTRVLHAVTANAGDVSVTVYDQEGTVLLTVGQSGDIPQDEQTAEVLALVRDAESVTLPILSEDGFLCGDRLLLSDAEGAATPTTVGYILLRQTPDASSAFPYGSFETVLLAAVWVMIAALIALYFITERTIEPLREMSRAAKKLSVGSFDTKVPVRGQDEIAQLAQTFNQMSDSLQSMERMRSAFIANVSHDLRTPMTTISGFIDSILDGVIPPEEQEHYLRVVSDEVRRLSRLVNQLLDISRLQAGERKLVKRSFDICEMGRQILISFEQKIEDKHLDVSFVCDEDRMQVFGDQDAVHQIFYNICDNAVKFSHEGGQLRLQVTRERRPERGGKFKVVVRVYNEGQGIPPEDQPYIFERFYKSDKSRSLDKTGVGLGMYIAKTIIEAHGESISVRSEYGKDCEFTFTMPPTEQTASGAVGSKHEKREE